MGWWRTLRLAHAVAGGTPGEEYRSLKRPDIAGGRDPLSRRTLVQRRALPGLAADALDQRIERLRLQFLAVNGARSPRDALVHQRAAQIVGAGVQAQLRTFGPHLDPGGLDIGDQWMQRQPRDSVHQDRFAQCRTGARAALEIDWRGHRHECQRHELGEAACARL